LTLEVQTKQRKQKTDQQRPYPQKKSQQMTTEEQCVQGTQNLE